MCHSCCCSRRAAPSWSGVEQPASLLLSGQRSKLRCPWIRLRGRPCPLQHQPHRNLNPRPLPESPMCMIYKSCSLVALEFPGWDGDEFCCRLLACPPARQQAGRLGDQPSTIHGRRDFKPLSLPKHGGQRIGLPNIWDKASMASTAPAKPLARRAVSQPIQRPASGPKSQIETLYNHPSARVISFTTSSTPTSRPRSSNGSPRVEQEPGASPWVSRSERTIAVGASSHHHYVMLMPPFLLTQRLTCPWQAH